MTDLAVQILGEARAFGDALRRDLVDARGLSVAVAFAKQSALAAVNVEEWCAPNRKLDVLAGTDFFLTELDLLRRLEKRPHATCRIFHTMGKGQVFHPKLYILDKGDRRVVYVGSSNFTSGGLTQNIEANVRLEGSAHTPEIEEASSLFESLFTGEYATEIQDDFEQRYRELQEAQRAVQHYPAMIERREALVVAEKLLLGAYRARRANNRWLLVTTPENFATCMRLRVWGRQNEREIKAYAPGDLFFFHVTGRSRIAALGMFTGAPHRSEQPIWEPSPKGIFPWRIAIEPLGELRNGINTKEVLGALRPEAKGHWFHGYIQQSHKLDPEDFRALQEAFEAGLRVERMGGRK